MHIVIDLQSEIWWAIYSFAWQRGYYESVNGYKVWTLGFIKMDKVEEVTIGHFTVRG